MNYLINIYVIIIQKMNIIINFVMEFFVKKIIIKMKLIVILNVMEMWIELVYISVEIMNFI